MNVWHVNVEVLKGDLSPVWKILLTWKEDNKEPEALNSSRN